MSAHDDNGRQLTDVELRDPVSLTPAARLQKPQLLRLGGRLFDSLLTGYSKSCEQNRHSSYRRKLITQLPYLTAVCQETLDLPIGLICVPRMNLKNQCGWGGLRV